MLKAMHCPKSCCSFTPSSECGVKFKSAPPDKLLPKVLMTLWRDWSDRATWEEPIHEHRKLLVSLQGCHFGSRSQNIILPKLRASFEKAGLLEAGVGISASDETSIDLACQSVYNYSTESLKCIDQFNTHCVSCSQSLTP